MHEDNPMIQFGLSFLWIASVIAASVVYRRRKNKSIFPEVPEDAVYIEKKAGSAWASGCLLVVVTPKLIAVTPTFPFTLMFLPELFNLEKTEWLWLVKDVEIRSSLRPLNTIVRLKDGRSFKLRLRAPKAFAAAVFEMQGKLDRSA